jgi:aminomethyltransferase
MVDFAGWSMPVQYTSIVEEHQATRRSVGLFDISHMGRLRFRGPGSAAFLDRMVTRRVTDLRPGKIRYGLMTNEEGGILDDVLVYHLVDVEGRPFHQMVVNAGNREKIVAWIRSHLSASDAVEFEDESLETAMIAVQGPAALATMAGLTGADLSRLGYYRGLVTTVCGHPCVASRTGYTGEDGCELIVARSVGLQIWEAVLSEGESRGARAVGLGARDTLRLEASMPLYGHELSETIEPLQAGLAFAVNLEGREFIGAAAIRAAKASPSRLVRVGLKMAGKRVPRQNCQVLAGEQAVGEVTSGTFSPTLDVPIAMAYVDAAASGLGTELLVDIRGRKEPACVVQLPFYVRPAPGGNS